MHNGDECDNGFWLTPEKGNALPIAITTSSAHRQGTPGNNSHWHAFCLTKSGIQRIPTSHGAGDDQCAVWQSAMKEACCSDLPVPRQGLGGAISPTTCAVLDETICKSQTGKACLAGKPPTCPEIRDVDATWGADNGDLCTAGYWMTPEEDSTFPLIVTANIAHGHDPTVLGNDPTTNVHWHPFCMTVDGPERIKTVLGRGTPGEGTQKLWELTRKNAGCTKLPLPQTGMTMPKSLFKANSTEITEPFNAVPLLVALFVISGILIIAAVAYGIRLFVQRWRMMAEAQRQQAKQRLETIREALGTPKRR